MSAGAVKCWLVAYDIREPRRLRKVHRLLKVEGGSVQYSAFGVSADDRQLQALLQRVAALIDARADDVRAYHVPARTPVWALGRQLLPEGVVVGSDEALRLLGAVLAGVENDGAPPGWQVL